MRYVTFAMLAYAASAIAASSGAGTLPEYTAAQARKHLGEQATVVGTVDCLSQGRRHTDVIIGGCELKKAALWIVVPNEIGGPALDCETLRGVTIAVAGKIESSGGTPQITIKSTKDIQARSALQTNYIGHAYDKETKGDIEGAMEDLNNAIEHQPARRDEACEHLARLKEKKGDWVGALATYDRLVALNPNKDGSYYVRATAKKQHGDFEAAMADYEKAAELRSSPSDYIQMGNWRKEKGDATGAAAEYDKVIALCDRAIAGTIQTDPRSPLGSDPYFSRGCARELKGDLDGAVADYTQAIANNPARAAMPYGARGNIRRTRGDLSGAVADYQHKYQITQYPDDKQKLEQVKAEAGQQTSSRQSDNAQAIVKDATSETPSAAVNPATTGILGSPAEQAAEIGGVSLSVLIEFTGNGATNKGSRPNGLIFGSDGNIYGTTETGGANDFGTVFKMTPAGVLTTLVEFAGHAPVNSSGFPTAPLIEARNGNFYGTTSGGGVGVNLQNILDNGTVFELSSSGVLTTLVRFSCSGPTNKGCTPYAGLVQVPNGDFYGTTFSGGSQKRISIPGFHGFGTVYKMSPAGQLTTVYDFAAHLAKGQGGSPWSGLILGNDGNFYGTTWNGLGIAGSVFKLTPAGTMTPLVRFSGPNPPNKGGGPVANLIQASDGNFYGTTPVLGTDLRGTLFKMTPGGVLTNLIEFHDNDSKGAAPKAPLVEGNEGNLYGTTISGGAFGWGTIFQMTPSGSFRTLWNFNNPNKIHDCDNEINGALLKDTEGNFYGTSKGGGRGDWGTVFKLTLHDSGNSTRPRLSSPATALSPPATTKSTPQIAAPTRVVTQPSIHAAQEDEQSLNKSEVSPESIAEAFVQAYSGMDVDALASLYGDRVDHTNSGVISNAAVRAEAKQYFTRWPVRRWSLVGPVDTVSLGTPKTKIVFSATYDASNPQTNKHASGIAKETLILASDKSGAIKIVSQKEQTSKKSRQSDEETLGDLDLKSANAEANEKRALANPSQTNAHTQVETGSPDCTSDPRKVWSKASPDNRLLAVIRFVPNPDKNWRAFDDLKITVFRRGPEGKPGQILASSAIGGRYLQCAHWSPDSQFLLFTTSPSRGGHGGWHFETFVYCAGDHSFRGNLEDVVGNVLALDFGFDSPDIAVLTVFDDQAPSTAGDEQPTKQLKVSLSKVVDKLDRLR